MSDQDRDPKQQRDGSNCDDLTEAALGAEQMISRMQDVVTEAIQPDGDQDEAFEELIEALDPAPEGDALRQALDLPKHGTRDLPKGQPRRKRGQARTAEPSDKPPEYRTWRTGP